MGEIVLNDDAFLVSETDRRGVITFANDEFIETSGYSKEDLMGKPHSLVRHADMPKAAFKDLWDTVQNGKTWTGFVKNKAKNGDFYWVYATVYPMEGGYMSCRKKPSRDEILQAEALYKTMK